MKRSNRLVLLVGVFLAVIAFVGVLVLSQGTPEDDPNRLPTEATVIVAREDIPLGTAIQENMIEPRVIPIAGAEADAYVDVSQVIGAIARQDVLAGAQITVRTTTGTPGTIVDLNVPGGQRGMPVLVDQVTGVGTLIKTGDYVDVLVRAEIQPTIVDEDTGESTVVEGVDTTTTKLLLQGLQVIGTLLPPPPPAAEGAEGGATTGGTALTDQQEIVILSVTPAQAEVLKFVENTEGQSVSLVLRSPADFLDEDGNPRLPESPCVTLPLPSPLESPAPSPAPYRGCEVTDGVVISTLVEEYGVLVPGLIEFGFIGVPPVPTPAPAPSPTPAP